jgi:hypothetical protein
MWVRGGQLRRRNNLVLGMWMAEVRMRQMLASSRVWPMVMR